MQRYNRQKWRRGFKELHCVKKEKRKFVDFALQLELSTMSEISELILLLNKQHQEQMTVLRDEHREQNKQHQEQMAVLRDEQNKQHQEQMTMLQEQLKTLQSSLNNPRENVPTPMASFQPSIPHLSYGLIIWQGSEHSSLLTLFPTTSKHKFFLPTNLTPFTKCLAT